MHSFVALSDLTSGYLAVEFGGVMLAHINKGEAGHDLQKRAMKHLLMNFQLLQGFCKDRFFQNDAKEGNFLASFEGQFIREGRRRDSYQTRRLGPGSSSYFL